jgi:hypothetical protein
LTTLHESINDWREPVHVRIKRSDATYRATENYVTANLKRLIELYNTTKNDEQTYRLIRDDIDNALRRYHGYCIKERIGAHYMQKIIDPKDPKTYVFEHMVPNSTVREMLIAEIITPVQACNMPTCLISRDDDVILKEKGWNSKTPDAYSFWKRYEYCFPVTDQFETWDGQPVNPQQTLEEHFEYFGIK